MSLKRAEGSCRTVVANHMGGGANYCFALVMAPGVRLRAEASVGILDVSSGASP